MFELSQTLMKKESIQEILLMIFHRGKLMVVDQRLPRARFEPAEALEKSVRRAVWEQTGGLLKKGSLLGVVHADDVVLPVYVCALHHLESAVTGPAKLVDIDVALLGDMPPEVLRHASRMYQAMKTGEEKKSRGLRWM